jgi:hypothetical protein
VQSDTPLLHSPEIVFEFNGITGCENHRIAPDNNIHQIRKESSHDFKKIFITSFIHPGITSDTKKHY